MSRAIFERLVSVKPCAGLVLAGRVEGDASFARRARQRFCLRVVVERRQMPHTASVRGWGYLPVSPERKEKS